MQDINGYTAVHIAAAHGFTDMLELLAHSMGVLSKVRFLRVFASLRTYTFKKLLKINHIVCTLATTDVPTLNVISSHATLTNYQSIFYKHTLR